MPLNSSIFPSTTSDSDEVKKWKKISNFVRKKECILGSPKANCAAKKQHISSLSHLSPLPCSLNMCVSREKNSTGVPSFGDGRNDCPARNSMFSCCFQFEKLRKVFCFKIAVPRQIANKYYRNVLL